MRKEILFFDQKYYLNLSHNKFTSMGKNLFLLNSGSCPKGKSFVLNLTDVINSKASLKEKGQYIYLASLRNYMDVLLNSSFYLAHYIVPEVPTSAITTNRLLDLRDGKIYFYYEEH